MRVYEIYCPEREVTLQHCTSPEAVEGFCKNAWAQRFDREQADGILVCGTDLAAMAHRDCLYVVDGEVSSDPRDGNVCFVVHCFHSLETNDEGQDEGLYYAEALP